MTVRARRPLVLAALLLGCASKTSAPEGRARLLSDGDGDGIMTEEGCAADCLAFPNPDPNCVYLEVEETPDGVCLACLDAALEELYSDCGALPEPPPDLPPGTTTDLFCDTAVQPDGSLCWTCSAPDGAVLSDGCAPVGAPADPGTFCTAAVEGGDLCVWCCDPAGAVLLEACDAPPDPIETTCQVYYDDGMVQCTRCVASGGWVASDECTLVR